MSLVRLDQVLKSYAGAVVLDGLDLRIEEGEHIGLIGRNGTGKSTIFKVITGEIEPEAGLVERMRRAPHRHPRPTPESIPRNDD